MMNVLNVILRKRVSVDLATWSLWVNDERQLMMFYRNLFQSILRHCRSRNRLNQRMHCIAIISLIFLAVGESSEAVDFSKQIAPIFQQHCIRCHSPNSRKGEVSVATFDDLKASEFVIPGDPEGSYLLELVTSRSGEPPAMPKGPW